MGELRERGSVFEFAVVVIEKNERLFHFAFIILKKERNDVRNEKKRKGVKQMNQN